MKQIDPNVQSKAEKRDKKSPHFSKLQQPVARVAIGSALQPTATKQERRGLHGLQLLAFSKKGRKEGSNAGHHTIHAVAIAIVLVACTIHVVRN